MAEEKDKVNEDFWGRIDPTPGKSWYQEQWEALKAEENEVPPITKEEVDKYLQDNADRIRVGLAVPQEEKKYLTDEQKRYFGWIAGTDPYRKEPGTSKFYLMDEAGATRLTEKDWPITDKMREGDAKRIKWLEAENQLRNHVDKETYKKIQDYRAGKFNPKPLPRWVIALAVAAFLGLCYIVLRYFSLG